MESASSVIELDKEVRTLFNNYHLLIRANNELSLEPVPPFEPLKPAPDTKVVPYSTKVQELTEKVHIAAAQLNAHYDQVANEDPEFIPYWNQDPTFTKAFNDLPKFRSIGWFESFRKYCQRMGLEQRLALEKQLDYFSPFFGKKSPMDSRVKSFEELNKEYHKSDIAYIAAMAFMTSVATLSTYSLFFNSPLVPSSPEDAIIHKIMYGTLMAMYTMAGTMIAVLKIKGHPTSIFNTCGSLKYDSKKADEVISLIKTLASE